MSDTEWFDAQDRRNSMAKDRVILNYVDGLEDKIASLEAKLASVHHDVIQDDIAAILRALGLGDHARPVSPHSVVIDEIIPRIEGLRANLADYMFVGDSRYVRSAKYREEIQ